MPYENKNKIKIYVPSSLNIEYRLEIIDLLREVREEVCDLVFKKVSSHRNKSCSWNAREHEEFLNTSFQSYNYLQRLYVMKHADMCVLVLPCDQSAHMEAGFMVGLGKPLHIVMPGRYKPETMYKAADSINENAEELISSIINPKWLFKGG
jgi:nucleoside 2-deoxyribosyltransferase